MPGRSPESSVAQPGGSSIETMPGMIIRAENRKYQALFPTMSMTAAPLPRFGSPALSLTKELTPG